MMMLRTLTIFHFALLLLQWNQAWGAATLSDVLEGIHQRYGNLPSLTLPYTREVITRSMAMLGNRVKGDTAKGRIYFRPPHFLRLEQEIPRPETLVTDGHTLWWFVPEKGVVYQYPSKKFGKELALLSSVFQGLTLVEKDFQVEITEKKGGKESQLLLRPNPPWEGIDRIVLTVTPAYDISLLDIHNQLGGTTRFRLESPSKEKKLADDFFRFIVPEGVRLIQEGLNGP